MTPHMHIIPYHIPFFMEKHGCFKKFSRKGVKKNNDDAKWILFQKSNKWKAAKDIILRVDNSGYCIMEGRSRLIQNKMLSTGKWASAKRRKNRE